LSLGLFAIEFTCVVLTDKSLELPACDTLSPAIRKTETMTTHADELHKQVLDHAWNWFNLHASQRMQTFNFFLVASAALIAAYASLLEKYHWAALVVGLVGAWISYWFTRLDGRTRQLIEAGENVLKISQAKIEKEAALPSANILETVETAASGASSYRIVIGVIEWTMVVLFILAAAYAGYLLEAGHTEFYPPG
jgi:hypothetical protein